VQVELEIILKGESHKFVVSDEKPLLQSILELPMMVRHGCKGGICGHCRVMLAQGEVRHFPQAGITKGEEEQGYILACCAVPVSDTIVLDYDR